MIWTLTNYLKVIYGLLVMLNLCL